MEGAPRPSAPYLSVWQHCVAWEEQKSEPNVTYIRSLFEDAVANARMRHAPFLWIAYLLFESQHDPPRVRRQLFRAWQSCPGSKGTRHAGFQWELKAISTNGATHSSGCSVAGRL